MRRRDFVAAGAAAGALPFMRASARPAPDAPFALDYAPHFGMFEARAGKDPVDQLRWMHERGFRSIEDNGMRNRPVEEQERIGKELARLGMRMGIFVLNGKNFGYGRATFASGDPAFTEEFLADTRASIEVAKRTGAKWLTVVMGEVAPRIEPEYQTAYGVEVLRRAAALLEPHGMAMVIETLNRRDHPSMYLTRIPQAYQICRAVNSPACKILFDCYHAQIAEGSLIYNLDAAWSEVGYVQVGDSPGRREPGTGEVNFAGVFRRLKAKGYRGIIGMEHGASKSGAEGEDAVIAAYRAVDPTN